MTQCQLSVRGAVAWAVSAVVFFSAGAFVLGYESALIEEQDHRTRLIEACRDQGLASTVHTDDVDIEMCVMGSHRKAPVQ